VVKGELVEEELKAINTPAPGASGIQAEVSLLETSTSADGTTIRVGVSILNTGATAFKVSTSDVSLTPEGATPQAPTSAEPALPREIMPGASEMIYFTFPRSSSGKAILKIFDIEFDVEGF
jgi:hypothetical protein